MKNNKQICFIGITAPLGADQTNFTGSIKKLLIDQYKTTPHLIKVSDFFETDQTLKGYEKLKNKIEAGNKKRKSQNDNTILAKKVINKIKEVYTDRNSENNKHIFIIDQLKRPEEVKYLKSILGRSFWLAAIDASDDERTNNLKGQGVLLDEEIKDLKDKDDKENDIDYGQQSKKTYLLADVIFKNAFDTRNLERFLDLLFGSHKITPSPQEYFMNLAFSASLKSGDTSRQVGAVLTSKRNDLISCGANETNKFKGGNYWRTNEESATDLNIGYEANKEILKKIEDKISEGFIKLLKQDKIEMSIHKVKEIITHSGFNELTGNHRSTHAEMDALLTALRVGANIEESTIYSTTFPCQNCAKHIVSAGVVKVIFLEPYPKSKALELHTDSISINKDDKEKVVFSKFFGITHNRFKDLFSTVYSRGKDIERKSPENKVPPFKRDEANLRFCADDLVQKAIVEKRDTDPIAS